MRGCHYGLMAWQDSTFPFDFVDCFIYTSVVTLLVMYESYLSYIRARITSCIMYVSMYYARIRRMHK